jgi:hypothetical protein
MITIISLETNGSISLNPNKEITWPKIKRLSWIIFNELNNEIIISKDFYVREQTSEFDTRAYIAKKISPEYSKKFEKSTTDIFKDFISDIKNTELLVCHSEDFVINTLKSNVNYYNLTLPDIHSFCTSKTTNKLCGFPINIYPTLHELYEIIVRKKGEEKKEISQIDKLLFCFKYIIENKLFSIQKYNYFKQISEKHLIDTSKKVKLYPFLKRNKWGFSDYNKNIIVECIYDDIEYYSLDYFFVKKNNLWAILDKNAENISEFNLKSFKECKQKLLDSTTPYNTSNTSNQIYESENILLDGVKIKDSLIENNFDIINDFVNGLAIVKKNNRYGVINKNGSTIISIIHESLTNTGEGIFIADRNIIYDYSGNTISIYDYITPFQEGVAFICQSYNGKKEYAYNYKFGLIKKDGTVLSPCIYYSYYFPQFTNGYTILQNEEFNFLLVNVNGEIIKHITYKGKRDDDLLWYYSDKHLVLERIDDAWLDNQIEFTSNGISPSYRSYLINHQEEYIIDIDFKVISEKNDLLHLVENIKFGLFAPNGSSILDCIYEDILDSKEAPFAVKNKSKWGFVDSKENIIVPFIYDKVSPFEKGVAIVVRKNKWSIVDKNGYVITTEYYDKIEKLTSEIFKVTTDRKFKILKIAPNITLSNEYDDVLYITPVLYFVRKNKLWGAIDKYLNIFVEIEYEKIEIIKCIEVKIYNKIKASKEKYYVSKYPEIKDYISFELKGKKGLFISENKIIQPIYDEIIVGTFFILIRVENLWGALDRFGNMILDIKYQKIFLNFQSLLCISIDANIEFIDFFNPMHNAIYTEFSEDFIVEDALPIDFGSFLIKENRNNQVVWQTWDFYESDKDFSGPSYIFSEAMSTNFDWTFVKDNFTNKWGIIYPFHPDGTLNLLSCTYNKYDILEAIDNDNTIACINGKYGVINKYGCTVINFDFAELKKENSNFLYAKKASNVSGERDKWGILKINGDLIKDFIYEDYSSAAQENIDQIYDDIYIEDYRDIIQTKALEISFDRYKNATVNSFEITYFISGIKYDVHNNDYCSLDYSDDKDIRIGLESAEGANLIPQIYDVIEIRKDGFLKVGKYIEYYMDKNGTIFKE